MTTRTTGPILEHAIGAEGVFSIRLRDGEARIRGVDGGAVRIRDVKGHDLGELFAAELGDGSASLRSTRGMDRLGRGGGPAPDLEIDLPRRATVVIETGSAEVDADGLLGDQRYRTASGDLTLRGVGGRIAVEAVSGDVDVIAGGEADVSLRTVSGDVELRAGTLRSLQATTTSGDLKVAGRLAGPGPFSIVTVSGDALLAPVGDVRVEMATLSGDLHSELAGTLAGGAGRRSLSIGSGGPRVEFRSMSGDLTVVRPTPIGATATSNPDVAPHGHAPGPVDGPADPADAASSPNGAIAAAYENARLRILRSLERGEIDVAEAGRRLEALDSGPGESALPGGGPSDA
jgi:DUF4097 and DUF4098 domain-containing protein YvlB